MKTLKYLFMLVAVMAMSLSFTSCGSDDDDDYDRNAVDSYICKAVSVKGGGPSFNYDAHHIIMTALNDLFIEEGINELFYNTTRDEAITNFNKFIYGIAQGFHYDGLYDNLGCTAPLDITISLVTRTTGKTIKTSTIHLEEETFAVR